MDLIDSSQYTMYTLASGWHYPSTAGDRSVWCSYNDLELSKKTPPAYLLMITEADECTLYVCADTRLYVLYLEGAWKMLLNALTLEETSIPPRFEFFDHSYIQHAGPG